MALNDFDIYAEARRRIEAHIKSNTIGKADWIVRSILADYPLPADWHGDARDLTEICRQYHVRKIVGQVFSEHKKAEEEGPDDGQLVLEGFNYLLKGYVVKRNHEAEWVPIDQLTSRERKRISKRLRRVAKACVAHADELDRYDRQVEEGEAA